MICPNCQADNPCEANFCMNCGTALRIICQNCNTENPRNANYCNQCGAALRALEKSSIPASSTQQQDVVKKFIPEAYARKLEAARRSQTMQGERRIVSILFCDVKGSTSMAEQLDPEEWAEIMNQAFEYLISPIYTYEGTLARLMGDSVLAFFGAPIGHEDDAKRAILSGMKIVKDIQPFKEKINQKYNLDFDVRVGINTGLVVVGGVGSDMFMEYTALGDAINIASRMEQTAQPGTIQVGEDTYKQTADYFEFEILSGVEIRGKAEPVNAYRVLGVLEDAFGDEAEVDEIPLIGRSAELNLFTHAIETVQKGSGQIVCLIGEAGLGKTRLLKETRSIWESVVHADKPLGTLSSRWNQASGLSYESSRPYGLMQRLIRNYIGLTPTDTVAQVKEKLHETLSMIGLGINDEWVNLFELMLGVQDQENVQELSGENLKRKIYSELLRTMEMLAQEGPTVIAVDDLHWSDPASAEFLVHLFQLVDQLPILFICSFRPHQTSEAWMVKQAAERDYIHRYTQINLQPFSKSESSQMIESCLPGVDLPPDMVDMVLEKSDGNPFFVEEVIRGLKDDKVIVQEPEGGAWVVQGKLDDITIPETLSAVITARIDRLGEASRRVLQLASVIGRTFYLRVLDVINDASDDLISELVTLQRMGLIVEVSREPEPEYIFRQAFTQETAYNTILLKHRREYHRQVGEAILNLFPDQLEKYSSVLGHHFYQAHDARALQYFKIDADSAFRIYANTEAIIYYGKAIEVAGWKAEQDIEELADLYMSLGRSYELDSQFKKALEKYKEFENIAVKSGDRPHEMAALVAQAQIYSVPSSEFSIEHGEPTINKAEQIAEELGDRETLAKILWLKMNLYRFSEGLESAQKVGEKAIALARELGMEEQLAYSLNDANHAYSMNGQMIRAHEVGLEASELWKKLNNQPMLADSYAGLAAIYMYTGEFDKAYEYSDMAYEISERINNIWGKAYSRYPIGLIDMERGQFDLAVEHLWQVIHDSQQSHFRAGELLARNFLAVVYAEAGDNPKSIEVVEEDYELNMDYMSVTWAFFVGAQLLAQARGRHIEQAEDIISRFDSLTERSYFVARHYYTLGKCYVHLYKEEYAAAQKLAEDFMTHLLEQGVVYIVPEIYMLLGEACQGQGLNSIALSKYEEALPIAEKLGSRKALWQLNHKIGVCLQDAGKGGEAEPYFRQALGHLDFIFEHIQDADLRKTFTQRIEVQHLLDIKEKIGV